jgi:protein PhnA
MVPSIDPILSTHPTEMSDLPNCPECDGTFTYEDGILLVCPSCGHEWSQADVEAAAEAEIVRDANGNALENGDTVVVIKDLKVKGAGQTVKVGTKVKNIRLVDGDHDIDCKIDGIGAMGLKSEFVRKV